MDKQELYKSVIEIYLGKPFLERIDNKDTIPILEGNKKELTIFFYDIASWTTIEEISDPKTTLEAMNSILSIVIGAIENHNGFVESVFGNSILGVFGSIVDKSADDACTTAIECINLITNSNNIILKSTKSMIGIHTGEMILGNFGSNKRMAYSTFGSEKNIAIRIANLTKKYNVPILISNDTKRKLFNKFNLVEFETVHVVGRKQSITLNGLS